MFFYAASVLLFRQRQEKGHRKENIESTDQSFSDDLIWIIAKGICPVQYEPRCEKTSFLKNM